MTLLGGNTIELNRYVAMGKTAHKKHWRRGCECRQSLKMVNQAVCRRHDIPAIFSRFDNVAGVNRRRR